jgi:fimbrial chaperone protein
MQRAGAITHFTGISAREALGCVAFMMLLIAASPASAGDFVVTPIKAHLTPRKRSESLDLTNRGARSVRFQLSTYAWKQDAGGAMQLEPTEDVIFFPQLLTLAPGERRKVRLGVMAPADDVERAYRLLIRELPPFEAPEETDAGLAVKLVTNVGVPIFVQPARIARAGEIALQSLANGRVDLEVRNTGNVHFLVRDLRIVGLGSSGDEVAVYQTEGWYVLAGRTSRYEVELSGEECARVRKLVVTARSKELALEHEFDVPADACGSAPASIALSSSMAR